MGKEALSGHEFDFPGKKTSDERWIEVAGVIANDENGSGSEFVASDQLNPAKDLQDNSAGQRDRPVTKPSHA